MCVYYDINAFVKRFACVQYGVDMFLKSDGHLEMINAELSA